MKKKLSALFALCALVTAIAGTAPSIASSYNVKLLHTSVVKDVVLKEGQYRLNLHNQTATLVSGKVSVEVPVKMETADSKFDRTAVRYEEASGKSVITEIRIGGTKTKIVFAQ
jgi:hypothetical protein